MRGYGVSRFVSGISGKLVYFGYGFSRGRRKLRKVAAFPGANLYT